MNFIIPSRNFSTIGNLYTILQIPSTASQDEIRNAYIKLAKVYHPDTPTGDPDKFKQLHTAYETLKNVRTREEYNFKERRSQVKQKQRRTHRTSNFHDPYQDINSKARYTYSQYKRDLIYGNARNINRHTRPPPPETPPPQKEPAPLGVYMVFPACWVAYMCFSAYSAAPIIQFQHLNFDIMKIGRYGMEYMITAVQNLNNS